MMTMIQKTIDIPPNRMLSLELPETVPIGKSTMVISFIGQDFPIQDSRAIPTMEELNAEAAAKQAVMRTSGEDPLIKWRDSLDGKKIFDCGYDYQRNMRDEWE
jgi:hypothetical protein